ncbi:MAG: beta-galactosidase [Acidobacteria bacterium]|nr:beta-galactosidase [Acidobacteriota bacterium]
MRAAILALALAASASAAGYVQAVEFNYYLLPRPLWERELVWLKNLGVDTVEFSIPWNFHQRPSGEPDLTGETNPRRDVIGFIRLLRRLGLRAWVRPLPPVPGLLNAGGHPDAAQQRAWLKLLEQVLAPRSAAHGGPIAYVEGHGLAIGAGPPPAPVVILSATRNDALARSREAIATTRGSLLWTGVEDALYPAGWAADPAAPLRKGAVGLGGEERASTAPLRRDAALLRGWARLFEQMRPAPPPRPVSRKWPEGLAAAQLDSPAAGAVSIVNTSPAPFRGDLRVLDPATRKSMILPNVAIAPGQALWLPVGVSIGPEGPCGECSNFASTERIVYATAELLRVEFENGILAMEFAAPRAGEVVLQLARRPEGPYLAAGKPTDFDWDEQKLRARLPVPAGKGPDDHVRVGIAIEAPETSAFFNELHRLVIGRANTVSTVYSSAAIAARSRLRLPDGYTATAANKSPNEIDYRIAVPADAAHGDFASLAIEADGVALGRARVQLFRPLTVRLVEAIGLHFGAGAEVASDPPAAAIDPRGGAGLELGLRNNTTEIQTYRIGFAGEGLEFFPPKTEISIAPTDERRVAFRVFPADAGAGVRDFSVHIQGGAEIEVPLRAVMVPRAGTVVWSADLAGDGSPEWILESHKVRAVFSAQDGGRLIDLTWKDTGANLLPEAGILAQSGAVEVRPVSGGLEFAGKGWKRTATLSGAVLTLEQSLPLSLPPGLAGKHGNIALTVSQPAPSRAVLSIE